MLRRIPNESYLLLAALVAAIAALNALVGFAMGAGKAPVAVGVVAIPTAILLGAAVFPRPRILVYIALGLVVFGGPFNSPLPLPGSSLVYPADILVILAIMSWILASGSGEDRGPRRLRLRTPVLGVPFFVFALAILTAVVRGHQLYGLSYFSQPVRIFAYAGIAAAIMDATARQLYRAVVVIFYIGTCWHTAVALYYLAAGGSQTDALSLSTGGTRVLALSTAMVLAGSLVLALLNLDLDTTAGRRAIHIGVAALATFGIVVSLGRTTFAAVAVLVPLLLISLRRTRLAILSFIPLLLPAIVLIAILLPLIAPGLGSAFGGRLTGKLSNDSAVVTRKLKTDAAMKGLGKEPVLGFGFGHPYTYRDLDTSLRTLTGDPENGYVFLLVGGGFFALGAWLLLGGAFVWNAFRRLRFASGIGRVLVLWSLSVWFILWVNILAGPVMSAPSLLLLLWIAMLVPALVEPEAESAPVTAGPDGSESRPSYLARTPAATLPLG